MISDANLRGFKADLWMTLAQNRNEVPGLIRAIKEGRINGSQYEGECACLVGTIANIRHVPVQSLESNSANPAERWFLMIKTGDIPGGTSGGSYAAQQALDWIYEWCAISGVEIPELEPILTSEKR